MKPRIISRKFLLLAVLLLATTSSGMVSEIKAVSTAAIPTEGGAWPSPSISVLIVPQDGQSWFRSSYTFDVNHAIARWSESIIAYTDSYGSGYLRKLAFTTCVSGSNDTLCGNPDIQVQFVQSFGPQSAGLGLTSFAAPRSGVFQPTTRTTLAAFDPTNTVQLSDADMINIASHEFGHALGLDHANVSRTDDGSFELMFLSYGQIVGNPANSLEAPSSLDLYALGFVYDWLATSSTLTGAGHFKAVLSMPAGMAYSSVYPYPEQVQMLQSSADRARLEIIVLAIVAAVLLALVLTFAILLARKKPVPSQSYSWPTTGPSPTA